MSSFFASLLWMGAVGVYVAWWRRPALRVSAVLGLMLALAGLVGTLVFANSFFSGLAEATAHFLCAATLMALVVPLATSGAPKPRRVARLQKPQEPMHGAGRITAAIVGAPLAALLAAGAVPKLIPLSSDARYFVAVILVVPAMTVAPWFALSARSAVRAWSGSGLVGGLAAIVIWSSFP